MRAGELRSSSFASLNRIVSIAAAVIGLAGAIAPAQAQQKKAASSKSTAKPAAKAPAKTAAAGKPNILIIWGDDIGFWNVSAYNQGMMGYRTPNIDRIAKEGALFTDWYGQQSCTAGRASFITGQVGFRTGLLKVGLPGAKEGLQARDVTIAELLKGQGYATGQFGKNHLGDRDEQLPTAHGFDEFYGSLYHLNAEQEPEHPDYFKDPEMRKRYATRGVLHCWANPDGTQKIELTGPLNIERMKTVDEEFTKEALRFMEDSKKAGKPFFLWWNSTRMHIWTHLKKESEGKTGLGLYPDGMVEHDAMVGRLLDKLKELGLEDNTIVMYSTDNGAEKFTWPDGGQTPFRSEKASNWEGAYRVPCAMRWPGVIKPGTVKNQLFAALDWVPTFVDIAGGPKGDELKQQIEAGKYPGIVKTTLDGFDQRDYLEGKSEKSARDHFFYFSGATPSAVRYKNWKMYYNMAQPGAEGWLLPLIPFHWTLVQNIKRDPFEQATGLAQKTAMSLGGAIGGPVTAYIYDWNILPIGQLLWEKELRSYQTFPPLQAPETYNLVGILDAMKKAGHPSD